MSPPKPKAERLFWIKYNPTEWHGMYSELSDEEYGIFHRIVAKLWATPGNRLSLESLLTELRLNADSPRASIVKGLIGYALKEAPDGLLYVAAIDEAFAGAAERQLQARKASTARWGQASPDHPTSGPALAGGDF
jgi:hypothetical protein